MGSSPSKGTTNANGSLVAAGTSMEVVTKEPIKIDDRLPYANFRELFTVKNYWKTISRRMEICSKIFLFKFVTYTFIIGTYAHILDHTQYY